MEEYRGILRRKDKKQGRFIKKGIILKGKQYNIGINCKGVRTMKKVISVICAVCFLFSHGAVFAAAPEANAKSSILMEYSTGQILAENNADERLSIASVTKIMTLLLIMEALDAGKIKMEDMVTVSENAMSMGGSTMFLEAGEQLSVDEMIKGIAVASANDGCVAMAEHLCGSEEAFVDMMNERAKELGMDNTQFMNTNGLDEEGHYSSARDVAKMSRELMSHEKIFEYTTIWTGMMHNDKFELANTNKLIRFYQGANGLKTGSTSEAGCCLSASAKRNDMQLIAVVLGAPTSKDRFNSARALLDYGFANYAVEKPFEEGENVTSIKINKGTKDELGVKVSGDCGILVEKSVKNNIETEFELPDEITAPIAKNDKVGIMKFVANGEVIGERDLVACETIEKKGLARWFIDILKMFINA